MGVDRDAAVRAAKVRMLDDQNILGQVHSQTLVRVVPGRRRHQARNRSIDLDRFEFAAGAATPVKIIKSDFISKDHFDL